MLQLGQPWAGQMAGERSLSTFCQPIKTLNMTLNGTYITLSIYFMLLMMSDYIVRNDKQKHFSFKGMQFPQPISAAPLTLWTPLTPAQNFRKAEKIPHAENLRRVNGSNLTRQNRSYLYLFHGRIAADKQHHWSTSHTLLSFPL